MSRPEQPNGTGGDGRPADPAGPAPRRQPLGAGAGVVTAVSTAFLAGSTANLPNDFKAADAAGTPRRLTALLAAIHATLAIALLVNALPRLRGR